MTWNDTLRTAIDSVRAHRLRSALTMLGILIGIAAVVLTVGIGSGAKADIADQIDELGTNLLVVSPGSSTDTSGARGGFGSASTLTRFDAEALSDDAVAPDIADAVAVSTSSVSILAGSTNWTTTLTGTTEGWAQVRSRDLDDGRFLTAQDDANASAVIVLGPDTATELFDTTDVVGETVSVNGTSLEVVGVLSALSSSDNTSNNDVALVPLRTYAQRLVGGTTRDAVSSIYVKATTQDTLSAAYQQATAVLVAAHNLDDAADADFSIATQESILTAASAVDDTMSLMLGGVAVISLLVGGIGVMNIMLVSVTERVREIGLRKAIGGRPRDIGRQFLVEALVLGLLGGALGVAVGIGGAVVLPLLTDARVVVSPTAIAAAMATATIIGLGFGVYPASRAARLAPIDALRSE